MDRNKDRQRRPSAEEAMSAVNRQKIAAMMVEEPNDPELRYMLAMEHASAGDDAAAVRCFQELIQRVPHYPPAYHQAGRSLQRLNRSAEARAILTHGIPVAEKQGDAHAADEMMELWSRLEY